MTNLVRSPSAPPPLVATVDSFPDEPSVWNMVNPLLRNRRLILGVPLVVGGLVAGLAMRSEELWTSSASFLPSSVESSSRSAGALLAQQFGISLGSSDPGQTSAFYSGLLTTKEVLRSVVMSEYWMNTDSGRVTGTLADMFGVSPAVPVARRQEAAVGILSDALDVTVDIATNVVTVSVSLPAPELSQQTATRMIGVVNDFNNRRIQQHAAARRQFSRQLVDSAEQALRDAERRLETFIQRNRAYASSPQLMLENDRLMREVVFRQELYTSVASSYEQARVDAMRDTPLITIVESPMVPLNPDNRHTLLQVLAAIVLSMLMMTFIAFGREYVSRSRRREPDQYETYLRLRAESISDLRRVLRPFSGRAKGAVAR